jgi:hypothetical protein
MSSTCRSTTPMSTAPRGSRRGRRNPGLWQLRIPLEGLGVTLHPDMYVLPWAEQQFDERGRLKEPERQERLVKTVGAYLEMARKLAG